MVEGWSSSLGISVSHNKFTVTDVTPTVGPRLATIAMVLNTQVVTSATILAVNVVVVEVAERWSA